MFFFIPTNSSLFCVCVSVLSGSSEKHLWSLLADDLGAEDQSCYNA